jgi:hypothetical protein
VRDSLDGDDAVSLGFLALIKFACRLAIANGKIGGFDVGPSQIAVSVLGIAFCSLALLEAKQRGG